jgi:hippurate hydrolase
MKDFSLRVLIAALFLAPAASAQTGGPPAGVDTARVDAIYLDIEKLYIDLHQNPELAFHEQRTAAPLRRA